MDKPIVIVEVTGGVAEVTTINAEDEVDVIQLDWDNIKAGQFDSDELQTLFDEVDALLPEDEEIKPNILSTLTDEIDEARKREQAQL